MRKWSALDYACVYGCSKELFREMLRRSQQLHEPNGSGNYLPHVICSQESRADPSLLIELFEAGVSLDSLSASGSMTPLMTAVVYGKLDHLQVLLRNNANLCAKTITGWEAIHYAASRGQVPILRTLKGLNIDWNRGVEYRLGSWNATECNVLHLTAITENNAALRYIAENFFNIADISCRNGRGESPLHLAAITGNAETAEILINYGADIDAENDSGERPVHYAARFGKTFVARALLQYGCTLSADARGLTPELVALKHGHTGIVSIFRERRLQQGMFPCLFNSTKIVEKYIYYPANLLLRSVMSPYLYQVGDVVCFYEKALTLWRCETFSLLTFFSKSLLQSWFV